MIKKEYERPILCFFVVLFFVVGIFGNLKSSNTVSWNPFVMHSHGSTQLETDSDGVDWLIPVEMVQKMDDFHVTPSVCKTNFHTEENIKGVEVVIIAIIMMLLLHKIFAERRICLAEKRIHIFEVVSFIHRIDGKKKTSVLNGLLCQMSKQEVNKSGSWYKI